MLTLGRLALVFCSAAAWKPDGHGAIAHIAETRLSEGAAAAVKALLPAGTKLADWASWADSVLHGPDSADWMWSASLHYVNTPENACGFDYARDCHDDWCVNSAITNYTARLGNQSLSLQERRYALYFLTHFVGDIHQPLHVGESSNLGGNKIHVKIEFADMKNWLLHTVWDGPLIDQFESTRIQGEYIAQNVDFNMNRTRYWTVTYDAMTKELAPRGKFNSDTKVWTASCDRAGWSSCVNGFADESASLACSKAYVHVDGSRVQDFDVLPMAYYDDRVQTALERITQAGIRLQYILEKSLGTTTSPGGPIEVGLV